MGMVSFMHLNKVKEVKSFDIDTMKLVELKAYAKDIGCDITSINNYTQAKKIVKEFLVSKEATKIEEQKETPKSDEQNDVSSQPTGEVKDDENLDVSVDEPDVNNS